MSPLVSVIIPTHNCEKFISETIESVLNQTYQNFEIIIVDDGSTDKTKDVISKYLLDERIIYINQKNSGAASARNKGFEYAKGDYIQYLDADDLLSKYKVESQIEVLKHENPFTITSCPWVHFNYSTNESIVAKQKVWKDYSNPIEWLIDAWSGGGMMQTACWLVHRSLILKAGKWDENLIKNPNDDGEFFCRVILNSKSIIFAEQALVYYRIPSSDNVSRQRCKTAVSSLLDSYISYKDNVLVFDSSFKVKRSLANNFLNFIYQYHTVFPELAFKAEIEFFSLNVGKMWPVGGSAFKFFCKIVGFKNSLFIKNVLFNLKKKLY